VEVEAAVAMVEQQGRPRTSSVFPEAGPEERPGYRWGLQQVCVSFVCAAHARMRGVLAWLHAV
jgi:hypothetical protein